MNTSGRQYITTFYAHIGAIRYRKLCQEQGIDATIMPVPRSLSSSCGACVSTVGGYITPAGRLLEEIEQIVEVSGEDYIVVMDLR